MRRNLLRVCGSNVEMSGLGTKEHPRQDLNARSSRDGTRDDAELLRQLVALTDDLYPRPYHGVAFNHLRNLVVVIGGVNTVEDGLPAPG